MKKSLIFTLILTLFFTFGIAAQSPEEIIDEYTYGGTLRLAADQTPEGMFNPLYSETVYDSDIHYLVFEGLTTVDANFEPQPELALAWDISDDYLTYTFYLDDRAKFHDGVPLTAEDVKFTYEMFLHPDYSGVRASNFMEILGAEEFRAGETESIEGIRVIDDHTIEITLRSIYAPFLVQTATFGIVPKHILGQYEPAEISQLDFNLNPIGSGPFKFVEYVVDEYTKLEAFEDYREGRPYLDTIIWNYVDDQALIMMLERGEVDYAEIPGENFQRSQEWGHTTLHKSIRNGFGYLAFNLVKDTPVAEAAVRRAIAHGINRKGFQEVVMDGLAVNTNSPISQASWAYTNELNPYDYDPERSQQILKEAGWEKNASGIYEKDGETLSFTINASSGSDFIDQLVAIAQDNLNSIGFDVDINKMEFNMLRERLDAGELDVWFMGWSFGDDPDPYNVWHSEGDWNRTGFSDQRADEMIELGRSTLDRAKRRQYYVEFQKIWNESMPYLPMYANIYLHVVHDRVRGINPDPGVLTPFGNSWNRMKEIWIPKHYRN